MDRPGGNPQTQPAAIIIIGSLVAAASTALVWMKLEAPDTETVEAKGLDLDAGSAVILFAVVAVVLAIIQLLRGSTGKGRGQAIANIVMTAFIAVMAIWVLAAPADVFASQAADEVAAEVGISEEFAEEAIKQGVDEGAVDVSAQLGAFGALIGGLAGLAGSILGVRKAPKAAPAVATAPPPAGAQVPGQGAVPPDQPASQDPVVTAGGNEPNQAPPR